MQFETKIERMQHPQVSLIPSIIWWGYFSERITRAELNLMKSIPKKIRLSSMKWRPSTICLCILYGHPEISATDFLKILDKKTTTIKFAMKAAAITNRVDILKLISLQHQADLNRIIESDHFNVVREAARFGSFNSIKYLIKAYKGDLYAMLRADSYEIFLWSCIRTSFKSRFFDFLLMIAPELKEEIISFRRFHLLQEAARRGNSAVLNRIISFVSNKVEYVLSSDNYKVFSQAAYGGRVHILKLLFSLIPEKTMAVVKDDHYKIARMAAEGGKISVIKYLFNLFPFEIQNMLYSNDFDAFYVAAGWGKLSAFDYMFKKLPKEKIDKMIQMQFSPAFQRAAEFGHFKMVSRLSNLAPLCINEMIVADNYAAFRNAARFGKIKVLKLLVQLAPNKIYEMVSSENFYSFRKAAFFGSLETIDYLFSLFSLAPRWMIYSNNYQAFSNAASQGHLHILKRLVSKAPDRVAQMLEANKYDAFCQAVRNSHLDVVKFLIKLAGDKANSMVISNDYLACEKIADLQILKCLISLVPGHKERIIFLKDFEIFSHAVVLSRLDLLKYLVESAPDKAESMIASNNFYSFKMAAHLSGDLEILRYLLKLAPNKLKDMVNMESLCAAATSYKNNTFIFEYLIKLVPDKLKDIVCANNCKVFREAAQEGNLSVVKLIFSCAPDQIVNMMELDNELIKIVISKEYIDVLDFMLSCSPKLLVKEVFLYPDAPYFDRDNWKEKGGTSDEKSLPHKLSRVFFENPSKLKLETKYELIEAFLALGYFSISKVLMIKFWENYHPYNIALLVDILIRANLYPNKVPDLLDFFVESMHFDPEDLIVLLKRISSDDLPLNFMGKFNHPRLDFKDN